MKALQRNCTVALFCIGATAAIEGATVLGLGQSRGASGTQLETPIRFSSDDSIVGIQMDLTYLAGKVNVGTISLDEAAGSGVLLQASEVDTGRIRLVVYSSDNRTLLDGGLLNIPLTFTGELAGNERGLQIVEVQLADSSGLNRDYQLAPFIKIMSPGSGLEFNKGDTVEILVDAYASSGELSSVSLYVDGNLESSQTEGPYEFSWTADARGGRELLVVATDTSDVEAVDSQLLSILSNFDQWSRENFPEEQLSNPLFSGFTADADLDGVFNGIEYLTNGDPLVVDGGQPIQTGTIEVGGVDYLSLSFEMPIAADDISYTVYGGSRLNPIVQTGVEEAVFVEEVSVSADVVRRTYRDTVPYNSADRFMFIQSSLGEE